MAARAFGRAPVTQIAGVLRLCCADKANHQLQGRERHQVGEVDVYRCRVCQRRHMVMHCGEPGVMQRPTAATPFPGRVML